MQLTMYSAIEEAIASQNSVDLKVPFDSARQCILSWKRGHFRAYDQSSTQEEYVQVVSLCYQAAVHSSELCSSVSMDSPATALLTRCFSVLTT